MIDFFTKLDLSKISPSIKNLAVIGSLCILLGTGSCSSETSQTEGTTQEQIDLSSFNTVEFHPVAIDSTIGKRFFNLVKEVYDSSSDRQLVLSHGKGVTSSLNIMFDGEGNSSRIMIFGRYLGEKIGIGLGIDKEDGNIDYSGAISIGGESIIDSTQVEAKLEKISGELEKARAKKG